MTLTLSNSAREDLRNWLTQICLDGRDDALPIFADWLDERGLPLTDLARQWPKSWDGGVPAGSLEGETLARLYGHLSGDFSTHRRLFRLAMKGKPTPPIVPRAIRDARIWLRCRLMDEFGSTAFGLDMLSIAAKTHRPISCRSEPAWIPLRVQRAYEATYAYDAAGTNWQFLGEASSGRDYAACMCRNEEGFFRLRPFLFRAPTGEQQLWHVGQCGGCRVVCWSTDRTRLLENTPEMLEGI